MADSPRDDLAYAEAHSVFALLSETAQVLIERKPADPLATLVAHFEEVLARGKANERSPSPS